MIDGFPFSFFLTLVVDALAGLMMGITGVITICWGKPMTAYTGKEEI